MKKLIAIAAVTMAVLSMLVAGSSPAAAQVYPHYGYHGNDYGAIDAELDTLVICDREKDGHAAYLRIEWQSYTYYLVDSNGSASGCEYWDWVWFDDVFVCERTKGCNRFY